MSLAFLAFLAPSGEFLPTYSRAHATFRYHVAEIWRRTLARRSQNDETTWVRMRTLTDDWLPATRVLHPWPNVRFAVTHPRWEPHAGKPHVRFCAGALSNERPYRDP